MRFLKVKRARARSRARVAEGPAAGVLTPAVVGRAYGLRVRRVPDAGRIILVPDAGDGPRLAAAAE